MGSIVNPLRRLKGHIPRSASQLEVEAKNLLKVVLWLALLAPVVIVPAYYLFVAFGLLPPVHLPAG